METLPLYIRAMLRAVKARSQPAAFGMSNPRRGAGYAQASGTDTPVFWDIGFLLTQEEAIVFMVWFTTLINRGVDEFIMPIRTEFGMIDHVCRFLPDSLLPAKEQGGLFGYTATIMARAQVIPDGYVDAAALIVALPNWWNWSGLLDQAVSDAMPGA